MKLPWLPIDYISFCVQSVILSKIIKIYPNNEKLVSKDIKNMVILKKMAFKNKDKNKDALNCKHLERELKNEMDAVEST